MSPAIPTPLPQSPKLLKLAVLASGKGSNLVAIADAIAQGRLNAVIQVVIFNNPDAGVRQKAKDYGLATALLNHRTFESREALDRAIIETVTAYGADWIIMAGWMRRVTEVLITAFPHRILNIHPSLLPSFPGIRAVEQALTAGIKITGCTVHYVELIVDSGPIVLQAAVSILPSDTPATLQARIQVQEHRIYPAAIAIAGSQFQQSADSGTPN
ncbi:MAG: phosphoribosylglycinamide formyltransferase [Cyanobacteria bacterium P01_C01_bin.70]